MLLFLWDMYQSQQIARVDAQAATARSAARDASDRAQDVERRIDALMLTNMAMWSLLSERLGITDKDLLDRMTEIDLSDGKLDGKVREQPGVSACASCGRTLSKRHARCFYCTAPNPSAKPFGKASG